MDPTLVNQLLLATLPPIVASVILLLPAWYRFGRASGDGGVVTPESLRGQPVWIAPLVLAVLYVVLYRLIVDRFPLPIRERMDWVPLFALGGLALAAVHGPLARAGSAGWVPRLALVVGIGVLSAWPRVRGVWAPLESVAWVGTFALATLVVWWALARVVERTRGAPGPLTLMVYLGGLSQVAVLGYHNFAQAQLVTIAAAFCGPLWVLAMIRPGFTLAGGTLPVVVAAAQGAAFQSVLWGSAEGWPRYAMAPIAMAGPLLGLLADAFVPVRPEERRLRGLLRNALRAGLIALPAGVAVAIGVANAEPNPY
jgi:hypothetical protein